MNLRRSLAISTVERYTTLAINFGSTVALARLLTPEEVGVYSVAAALAGFAHVLRDFGVTNYLIQERDLTEAHIRSALTVTCAIAWTFALLLALLGPTAADFYRQPGLTGVMLVIAASFAILPLSSTIIAMLRREMRFGTLCLINIAGAVTHAATAITLAALGHGFMSLAWAGVANVAVTAAFAAATRPMAAHFLPGFGELRKVLSFGSMASGVTLLKEAGWRAPELIMGRLLGFEAIGLYSRANGLVSLLGQVVAEAVQPVALPALAAKSRSGADLSEACRRALEHWWVLSSPFFLLLEIMARPLVLLLFGDQWLGAVPVVQIFAFAAVFIPDINPILSPLLLASGRVGLSLRLEAVLMPVKVALIALGALHSLLAVAVCLAIAGVIATVLRYHVFLGETGLRITQITRIALRAWGVALIAVLPVLVVKAIAERLALTPFVELLLACGGFGVAWLAALFALRHPLREEVTAALAMVPRFLAQLRKA